MEPFTIFVNQVEDLQATKDLVELDKIFRLAKSTIVQGERVILARKTSAGKTEPYDALTTEEELENYKKQVYKYL
jgi:hypothetical protein